MLCAGWPVSTVCKQYIAQETSRDNSVQEKGGLQLKFILRKLMLVMIRLGRQVQHEECQKFQNLMKKKKKKKKKKA